jgi:hypothetical protein
MRPVTVTVLDAIGNTGVAPRVLSHGNHFEYVCDVTSPLTCASMSAWIPAGGWLGSVAMSVRRFALV